MSTPVIADLSEAVHWRDEPHHFTLLSTPHYTIFVGDLPPHDQTLLHAHCSPSAGVALISTYDITNVILSDPVHAKQAPAPISIAKGAFMKYTSTPENPHIHQYSSTDHRSIFLVIESPLGRVVGPPTPLLSISAPSQVAVRHELADATFASAATITLPHGCTISVHAAPADEEILLSRLLARLEGPPLRLLDVRTPADVAIEHLQYNKCDPPAQAYLLSRFSNTKGADDCMTITNAAHETAQLVIIDYFAAHEVATEQPR